MYHQSFFFGLQIKQSDTRIFVSQTRYARSLLKKFGMTNAKHSATPMSSPVSSTGKDVDETFYRSMIGSLLYLTASRPDIAYNVSVCARYQSKPKESYEYGI
eukprot:TRINITY_DN95929_c0_g1_i1.p1 TRINITY_DN95929_c0_g1~~TRINITY_DN95929_c0_g1_i1.p1  ORF type:complete len:102 (-),score=4.85 TRINITY_DN95929_c0_g1_i1:199-504(-)